MTILPTSSRARARRRAIRVRIAAVLAIASVLYLCAAFDTLVAQAPMVLAVVIVLLWTAVAVMFLRERTR